MMYFEECEKNKKYFEDDIIYHYTKFETAIEMILPNRSLMFSSFKTTIDPFEKNHHSLGVWSEGNVKLPSIDKFGDNFINDIRYKEAKFLCFSKNQPNIYLSGFHVIDMSNYFKCGFFKMRMWDQYGQKNRGVCLALSKKKLIKQIKDQYSEKTIYHDDVIYSTSILSNRMYNRIKVCEDDDNKTLSEIKDRHIRENYQGMFFQKHTDWKDENEFRVLVIDADKTNELFVDISNCLEGIFCGVDFPEVYLNSLKSVVLDKNIDIFKLSVYDGLPGIIKK